MKKSILNVGKALNKAEQKSINGGGGFPVFCHPSPRANCQGDGMVWYEDTRTCCVYAA